MQDVEKAIELLRSEGYQVLSRTGQEPGVVYLIRFHNNNGKVTYSVRRHRGGLKDDYYGDMSEISKIELNKLEWEPLRKAKNE
jgi:hypothetical protein